MISWELPTIAVLIRMHGSSQSYPSSGLSPADYILLVIVLFKFLILANWVKSAVKQLKFYVSLIEQKLLLIGPTFRIYNFNFKRYWYIQTVNQLSRARLRESIVVPARHAIFLRKVFYCHINCNRHLLHISYFEGFIFRIQKILKFPWI